MPVAREEPHARRIAAHEHSEAVVLDFVQPPSPGGRLGGCVRQAGLAEVGKGYTTQQHGGSIKKLGAFVNHLTLGGGKLCESLS